MIFVSFIFLASAPVKPTQALAFTIPSLLPGENQSIPVAGSTVIIKGVTDQTNTLIINEREVPVKNDGSFTQEIIVPLGATDISVTVIDKQGHLKTYQKKIEAKDKYFFLVGIADGTLNLVDAEDGYDWQRDNSSFDKGAHLDGKISYYFAGKIKGKYLIKSALDTDKSTQEKLFSNIDPDDYYPVYGDSSTVVYDVNSQGKFYLLVEWDKSGFTFGNYQTMFDDTQLVKYNRTLYGTKLHLETPGRTVYGEPQAKLTGFLAEANQYTGHSEFLATGGSLYYLRHVNIVEGSEKIWIETRDKNTGMIISSTPQKENVDYEIKYNEGRILFRKPVLSIASSDTIISTSILEGNAVYIVAKYEYKSQEAFPLGDEDINHRSGGIRATKAIGDHIQVGGTYLREEKDANNYILYGQDVAIKIGNFTKLEAELARSKSESIPAYISYNGGLDFTTISPADDSKAKAQRFSLNSSLGEYLGQGKEFLDFSGYYQFVGRNFSPSENLFEAGTEKYGMALDHKLTGNDKVRLLAEREMLTEDSTNQSAENQLTARKVTLLSGQWLHTMDKFTFTTEYQYRLKEDSLSFYNDWPLKERILAEQVAYKFNDNTSLFATQQVTLSGHSNNQSRLGLVTKLNDTRVQAQLAFGNAGNSLLLGMEKNVNENTSSYITYTVADSKIDGKSSTTSFGSNTKISADAKLKTERQFITSDQRGAYASNLIGMDYQLNPKLNLGLTYQRSEEPADPNLIAAKPRDSVSVNISYLNPDNLKFDNKTEYREDTNRTDQVVAMTSAELKLTPDFFLFGEYDYSLTQTTEDKSYAKIDIRHIGFAFRPVDYDWFNCLFKYIKINDQRPEDLTSADGGFVKMDSTSDVYATEFALDLPFNLQLVEKYSYKDENSLSSDILGIVKTPEDLKAHLFVHRLNYHLTKSWDIAGEYRILTQNGSSQDTKESGALLEISRKVFDNVYLGVGCNFTTFTDDLTVKNNKNAKGIFFRLQGRY